MEQDNNRFGKYLRMLRKQNKYSQQDVADKLQIVRQTYSHYETGRIIPSIDIVCQLAEIYSVSVVSLMEQMQSMHVNIKIIQTDKRILEKENLLLDYFRNMNEKEQNKLLLFLKLSVTDTIEELN